MPSNKSMLVATIERRATYAGLTGLFLSLLTAFALREQKEHTELELHPFDLALLGLATLRLGRLVAYDKVLETFRLPVAETKPDDSGAGETVEPKGWGVQRAFGEMISCPICIGTWIAAALVYGLSIAPRPTRALMAIMSAVGIAEVLNGAIEALEWTGQEAREQAGAERASWYKPRSH
jgi:Protein of unknown function (DUF1360)